MKSCEWRGGAGTVQGKWETSGPGRSWASAGLPRVKRSLGTCLVARNSASASRRDRPAASYRSGAVAAAGMAAYRAG